MTPFESWIEFIGKTSYFAALMTGSCYLALQLARADGAVREIPSQVETAPIEVEQRTPNLVIKPGYVKEADLSEQGNRPLKEKLLYRLSISEFPLLKERPVRMEESDGVRYPEGSEVVVSPEPDLVVREAEIQESSDATKATDDPTIKNPDRKE